jgi:hypothetical protein
MIKRAAFFSYARADDEIPAGGITALHADLQRAIQLHLGDRDFQIFIDKHDLGWGDIWNERIAEALEDALIMFPIITPSFFNSEHCVKELQLFMQREDRLAIKDLVMH